MMTKMLNKFHFGVINPFDLIHDINPFHLGWIDHIARDLRRKINWTCFVLNTVSFV